MNDVEQKVKLPAIGLLIAGIINGAFAFLVLIAGVLRLVAYSKGLEKLPADQAERIGFYIGTVAGYGIALITLFVSPIIIYGAVQMMKGKKYKLSKAAAILAIVPFTACCMLVGAPLGIWAYIVLNQEDVRGYFRV
ncbi:MAG: hypothetical protein HKN25_15340 [Pyrinomonadaceae bacterium]|nr:hypothetical protein [Pyrinomonadaceae bacterium]